MLRDIRCCAFAGSGGRRRRRRKERSDTSGTAPEGACTNTHDEWINVIRVQLPVYEATSEMEMEKLVGRRRIRPDGVSKRRGGFCFSRSRPAGGRSVFSVRRSRNYDYYECSLFVQALRRARDSSPPPFRSRVSCTTRSVCSSA